MKTHKCKYRVLYADTDKMGVVYYGNYLRLYEYGRNQMMRDFNIPFSLIEKSGIVCPAIEVKIRYVKPVVFDEEITIVSKIKQLPTARFPFVQEIIGEDGSLKNMAEVDLCFVNENTLKPVRCPEDFRKILETL
ncbi:MAG: thioesterase family protein [Bacteroidales bacterium]|jgi:acyl-CoA thioester hydrolase|nr:thioesterase family protein [Bacteroidales bacterium]